MKQGEIYFVSLEPTKGHEQRGKRPVLVLSPEPFNVLTRTGIVAAITNGGEFAQRNGFAVPLLSGMRTTGIIRCDQIRTLDLIERGAQFVETVPAIVLDDVLVRIAVLLARH